MLKYHQYCSVPAKLALNKLASLHLASSVNKVFDLVLEAVLTWLGSKTRTPS